jgi:predicted glutamine amidotransferase
MCRLLGYVTRTPAALADLLGEEDLFEFTELSCKHGDGWGAAWATDTGVEFVKAPDAARMSSAFDRHVHEHVGDLGIVHLRWATLGLEVAPENTHPFTDGTVAFAHNGSIDSFSSLDALIPAGLQRLRMGSTDSERYFLAVLAEVMRENQFYPNGRGRLADSVAAIVERIAASHAFTSLNAMIATPDELIAVCCYDPAAEEKEEEPDYYRLGYRVTPGAVIVSSSGWGAEWSSLENGQILVVQRDTLDVSVGWMADARMTR